MKSVYFKLVLSENNLGLIIKNMKVNQLEVTLASHVTDLED